LRYVDEALTGQKNGVLCGDQRRHAFSVRRTCFSTIKPSSHAAHSSASGGGTANGHVVDLQRWLPHTDRHALAALAADADAFVERHIVVDHRDAVEHFRTGADQRGALDRTRDLAVLMR